MAPIYSEELSQLLADDQKDITLTQSASITRGKWLSRVHARTNRVREILEEQGISKISGGDLGAYKAMLVLVLHSGDQALMEEYLNLHTNNESGGVIISDRAFIVDKLQGLKKEKQIYGTQFRVTNGDVVLLPIENEVDVDKRRKELGLEPLSKYINIQT